LKEFDELGLAEPVLRAIAAEGYTTPTPIQAQIIPAALPGPDQERGRDVIGIAQTGTGKTAAFVLPLLDKLAKGRRRPSKKCCTALILAPTRELAGQIAESVRTYGRHLKPSVALIVGGAKYPPQIKALAKGVDIVVATPGRLIDHWTSDALRLNATTCVVLDEADQMMDLGFLPVVRRLMAALPKTRQTMLLSATMPKPVRKLADEFLRDPLEITVAQESKPIERIDQRVMHISQSDKRGALIDLLGCERVQRAIVFTRTKRGADRVHQHLEKAGLAATAIHGDKSQNQRERALLAFRRGRASVLVATDVAARGIDIDDVSHVVNFELPNVPQSYVHRIGRTARAGATGMAVSFCDASERPFLRDIERLIGERIRLWDGKSAQQAPANGNDPIIVSEPIKAKKSKNKADRAKRDRFAEPPEPARSSAPRSRGRSTTEAGRAAAAQQFPTNPSKGVYDMASGSVKWFNSTKGYGFIQPDDGGKDVFVHISAVEQSGLSNLQEGQKISYEVQVDKRRGKSSAVNLQAE
jgi:ATP-dependent RNA helicase RhlE